MTDLSSLAEDDDTGQIAQAIELARTNPTAAAAQTLPRLVAHERDDRRHQRLVLWAAGALLGAIVATFVWAWTAQANSGADRATIQDMHDRMVRIEGLLMERNDR